MTPRRWTFWTWFVGYYLACLALAALIAGNDACTTHAKVLADGRDPFFGCGEFWLNRYQQLLGAVAAIGAALYAGWWVRKQIVASEYQAAISQSQLAAIAAEAFQKRASSISRFQLHLRVVVNAQNRIHYKAKEAARIYELYKDNPRQEVARNFDLQQFESESSVARTALDEASQLIADTLLESEVRIACNRELHRLSEVNGRIWGKRKATRDVISGIQRGNDQQLIRMYFEGLDKVRYPEIREKVDPTLNLILSREVDRLWELADACLRQIDRAITPKHTR